MHGMIERKPKTCRQKVGEHIVGVFYWAIILSLLTGWLLALVFEPLKSDWKKSL